MVQVVEIPITGMDCAECTRHVRQAISEVAGVEAVEVFLGSEKAIVRLDPSVAAMPALRQAVRSAGYDVGPDGSAKNEVLEQHGGLTSKRLLGLLGMLFAVVFFVVVAGEWLGLFETLTARVPWYLGWVAVLVAGFPIFANVIRAAMRRQVISHTLMTLGVIAALAIGQWTTAAVVVFFMRVGDAIEKFTTARSRRALKDLASLAPRTARLVRAGEEIEVPVEELKPGDVVIVRPGERIPVDGQVLSGQAAVDQAAITGESVPVDAVAGQQVYAASIIRAGSLKVTTTQVGVQSVYGRVIQLVEEAEGSRGRVQLAADRFSAIFLPIVATIAALTFIIRRDPLAAAAVLVVACSCSLALATPVAMLASIGAAARRGILFKGGRTVEELDRADVILVDKTGTLTLGQMQVTDLVNLDGWHPDELLRLAASAERYSEHPLAEALRQSALGKGIFLDEPLDFTSEAGVGVSARVNGHSVAVGRPTGDLSTYSATAADLSSQGKTILTVTVDGKPAGLVAARDTLRPDVPAALAALRELGFDRIELLSGDNPAVVSNLADTLGIAWQAQLHPEDKIEIVRRYQAQGKRVIMIGDGINDAPALAQAEVGIAMAKTGTDIANESARLVLMREDWSMIPEAVRIARRTMRVVNTNLAFTAVYNLLGLGLAAFGILPPALAAAAQSLPDLGVMANSSRLLGMSRQSAASGN